MGERMGFAPRAVRDQEWAGLLHDIGNLGVSSRILDKPGPLTAAERAEIRKHPALTYSIASYGASARSGTSRRSPPATTSARTARATIVA